MARLRTMLVMMPQKLGFSKAEAAAYLGITRSSFDALVDAGEMPPARRFGAVYRCIRPELERAAMEHADLGAEARQTWDRPRSFHRRLARLA